jgi:hypothetical protein
MLRPYNGAPISHEQWLNPGNGAGRTGVTEDNFGVVIFRWGGSPHSMHE